MSDDELRQAWAKNFNIWRTDSTAESICRLICELISLRACLSKLEGSLAEKVRHICFTVGIRDEEYQAVTIPLRMSRRRQV